MTQFIAALVRACKLGVEATVRNWCFTNALDEEARDAITHKARDLVPIMTMPVIHAKIADVCLAVEVFYNFARVLIVLVEGLRVVPALRLPSVLEREVVVGQILRPCTFLDTLANFLLCERRRLIVVGVVAVIVVSIYTSS